MRAMLVVSWLSIVCAQTISPTESPTTEPTTEPTSSPTISPTSSPTTAAPSVGPTANPTQFPTLPTVSPTQFPTQSPTKSPTESPTTAVPTQSPTLPTSSPTMMPTNVPTPFPTFPTSNPTPYQPRRRLLLTPSIPYLNAIDWCKAQGGQLLSIHTQYELNDVASLLGGSFNSYWVGGQCYQTFGPLEWDDGTPYDSAALAQWSTCGFGTYPLAVTLTQTFSFPPWSLASITPTASLQGICAVSDDQSILQCTCDDNAIAGHWQSTGYWNPCLNCQPGWTGPRCEISTRNPCYTTTCLPGRGVCNNTFGSPDFGKCMCLPNWEGEFCDKCAPGFEGPNCEPSCIPGATCNGHGTCNAEYAQLQVSCGNALVCNGAQGATCCAWRSPGFYDGTINPPAWVFPNERGSYACAQPGQSCCGPNICNAGFRCVDQTYGRCCQKEYTPCYRKLINGSAAVTQAADIQCCHPEATCCDGVCCAAGAKCVEHTQPFAEGWYDTQGNAISPRMVCTTRHKEMIAASGMRAGLLPCVVGLALVVAAIIAIIRGGNKSGTTTKGEILFTFLFILVAFFLVFSDEWTLAVLYCAWATLALILSAGGYNAKLFALGLMASLTIIVAFSPGDFWLTYWLQNGDLHCYSSRGFATLNDISRCMTNCANYFAAFRIDPLTRSRDADPTPFPAPTPAPVAYFSDFYGLCSYEAVQFRFFLYSLLPALSFLACAAIGWSLLKTASPASEGGGKQFQCSSCNARMKPDARFCVMCGTPTVPGGEGDTQDPKNTSTDQDPKAIEMGQMDKQAGTDQPKTERGPDGVWREKQPED